MPAIASGILLAWTVSFVRVLVEVLVVNRALLPSLLPAMVAMTVVCAAFAAGTSGAPGRRSRRRTCRCAIPSA